MRKQKKAWLAALLNLVPLVGLVAVLLNTSRVSMLARVADALKFPYLFICAGVLELAIILWGLGYLYLQRWARLVAALCFPWLYALGYLVFPKPSSNLPDFYFPYLNEAVAVLGVMNVLSGIDAWFLAGRQGIHDQEIAPKNMTGADQPNMIGFDDPTEREVARMLSAKTSSEKPSPGK